MWWAFLPRINAGAPTQFSRSSDEYAGNEHECSAKPYLQSSGKNRRIHESVSHLCDDPEFDQDDDNRNHQGQLKLKWHDACSIPVKDACHPATVSDLHRAELGGGNTA